MRRGLITGLAVLTLTGTSVEVLAATPASAAASAAARSFVVQEPRPRQGFEFIVRPLESTPKPARNAKSRKARKTRKTQNTRDGRLSAKPRKGRKRKSGKNGEIRKAGNAMALRVPRGLERKLGDLYYRTVRNEPDVRRRDVVGPINIRYGKIVRKGRPRVVFYAIGDTGIFGYLINPKTLPHVWRKVGTRGRWKYLGPTPNGLCGPNLVPRKLAVAWRVGCK